MTDMSARKFFDSWKKITTPRCEGIGVVVEKIKKVYELSTKIRVIYLQQ